MLLWHFCMEKLQQFCTVRPVVVQGPISELGDTWPDSVSSPFVMYLTGTGICKHVKATQLVWLSLFFLLRKRGASYLIGLCLELMGHRSNINITPASTEHMFGGRIRKSATLTKYPGQ